METKEATQATQATQPIPSIETRARALADLLGVPADELYSVCESPPIDHESLTPEHVRLQHGDRVYIVATFEEIHVSRTGDIDDTGWLIRAIVEDNIWAFSAEVLANHVPMDSDSVRAGEAMERAISSIQRALCESANVALLAMVREQLGALIRDAVWSDGVAHLMGAEELDGSDVDVGGYDWFIYELG